MESDFCNLKSDSGDVSAIKIKAKNLNIETESGDIFCHGHIQVTFADVCSKLVRLTMHICRQGQGLVV
jgi:hypothetical protein